MPTPSKSLDGMSKHLTAEERQTREQAEQSVRPVRAQVKLKKPPWIKPKTLAAKYWSSIIKRMEGTAILDDLDVEVLGLYCAQLQERELLQSDLTAARESDEPSMDLILSLNKQINAKDGRIKEYASELGCTPSGRVRLAQKRSAALDAPPDPNGDLFGD